MGWERKRGKLEEFNRLLRGAEDTNFVEQVGDLSLLPSIAFCLTLDSDTRLPRDTARHLIGIAAHPMNRSRFDPRSGRVVEGYGILQPRVSITMASAAGSLFARTYAGHTGVDPYTTAVSDVYQDLFDEGIYTGKGLYDVDAFVRSLEGRVPENALLSHDSSKGCTRGPRSSPTPKWSTTIRRACSRMRGGSIAGYAATGRYCAGCSRSSRHATAWSVIRCRSSRGGRSRQSAPQPRRAHAPRCPSVRVVRAARVAGNLDGDRLARAAVAHHPSVGRPPEGPLARPTDPGLHQDSW